MLHTGNHVSYWFSPFSLQVPELVASLGLADSHFYRGITTGGRQIAKTSCSQCLSTVPLPETSCGNLPIHHANKQFNSYMCISTTTVLHSLCM